MPRPATLGELRAASYPDLSIKDELRANLIDRLSSVAPLFDSIVGYEETAVPALERALLAGHDVIMLGERGQAKSRLIRHLVDLLDEEIPAIAGCELNDHPYRPICARCRSLVRESGDATPIVWVHRTQRFSEKLATPDTSVADLIGDVDPIRVAEGRYLSDELTIHYGLVPRTNRGIFAINELPDLPERIQVALLNILEERDVQIRGYKIRLPLDLILIASANPEDYTHRGRIITPLKDRFGTQVRTHYPQRIDDEIAIMDQEARPPAPGVPVSVPHYMKEVLAELAAELRTSPQVNQRSGVSVRFSIGALEAVTASALLRAVRSHEDEAVPRAVDLWAVLPGASGRIEFDTLEEGREPEIIARALKEALRRVWSRYLGREDFSALLGRFAEGLVVQTSDALGARDLLAQFDLAGGGLERISNRLKMGSDSPASAASALEFALEGLHLDRRLNKDRGDGSGEWRFEGIPA
ncbi:MAG: sigma 54-interacting transcriptional regulator [Actinomycetota bacterium]